jgi:hypothetical protein
MNFQLDHHELYERDEACLEPERMLAAAVIEAAVDDVAAWWRYKKRHADADIPMSQKENKFRYEKLYEFQMSKRFFLAPGRLEMWLLPFPNVEADTIRQQLRKDYPELMGE